MEFGRVLEKGRIRARTEEGLNPSENWRRVEFERVPEKGRIGASTNKVSGRVLENVESRRVPEKSRIQVSTGEGKNSGEYRGRVEFGHLPVKGRILPSIWKGRI